MVMVVSDKPLQLSVNIRYLQDFAMHHILFFSTVKPLKKRFSLYRKCLYLIYTRYGQYIMLAFLAYIVILW